MACTLVGTIWYTIPATVLSPTSADNRRTTLRRPDSSIYVDAKIQAAKETGMKTTLVDISSEGLSPTALEAKVRSCLTPVMRSVENIVAERVATDRAPYFDNVLMVSCDDNRRR